MVIIIVNDKKIMGVVSNGWPGDGGGSATPLYNEIFPGT